ncbi:hypothetical protein [Chrysiogenes arsenatis]|uniref:hypothetical protein n=1 Tax=Chrysiogenes arsenatis TaxID=309797 RepID=UPI0003F9E8C8|nr:hypothetical protein [Chrysiogenes arsenatis]
MWRLSTGLRNAMLEDKGFKEAFANGVIRIFTGTQPANADAGETGTLLCQISLASGAFIAGAPENGINFGTAANGTIGKAEGEVWSGVNMETGTAGWFRFYANPLVTGVSATAIRIDGVCATSGGEMQMTNVSLVSGTTTTVDVANITLPAQ